MAVLRRSMVTARYGLGLGLGLLPLATVGSYLEVC